ncbi:hypothetical protein [Paraburkholderia terrae]|nr:hypothetical protein [Paraburkholderia terrae]
MKHEGKARMPAQKQKDQTACAAKKHHVADASTKSSPQSATPAP